MLDLKERLSTLRRCICFQQNYCFDLQRRGGSGGPSVVLLNSDGREEVGDKANKSSRAMAMGLSTAFGKVAKRKLKRDKGKKKRDTWKREKMW